MSSGENLWALYVASANILQPLSPSGALGLEDTIGRLKIGVSGRNTDQQLIEFKEKSFSLILALHLNYQWTSQVFINFATENIGMENIQIHGEDETDGPGSIEAVEA